MGAPHPDAPVMHSETLFPATREMAPPMLGAGAVTSLTGDPAARLRDPVIFMLTDPISAGLAVRLGVTGGAVWIGTASGKAGDCPNALIVQAFNRESTTTIRMQASKDDIMLNPFGFPVNNANSSV
jgi:hypothetical protein